MAGQGNVPLMFPEWTMHKGVRFEPSWERPPRRTAQQGVSCQSPSGSTLNTARPSGQLRQKDSQQCPLGLRHPEATSAGLQCSGHTLPLSSQPPSWALWGSQKQQLVSDKEAAPGECHIPPAPPPLQDAEPGSSGAGPRRETELAMRSKFR